MQMVYQPKVHARLVHFDTLPSLHILTLGPKYAVDRSAHGVGDRSTDEDIHVDSSTLVCLLNKHSRTMKSVVLDMVCLRCSWLSLLQAFRQLSNGCKLDIFAPGLVSRAEVKSVQFKWRPEEVNRDSMTIYRSRARVWLQG
ncbi:hypothetical protein E6O75_ATG09315 [Venturia nashicola]|uniref:Uncharacterized protein n=1 Tax=Venturia nashicola TaxID=86259 RepID=A0A4Z1P1T2_9PEZI|nr:hypothetical protein E6O75_ATG09315 [Venturia nashicola]